MEHEKQKRYLYEIEVLHHNMDFASDMPGALEAMRQFCIEETVDAYEEHPERIIMCYFKLPIREADEPC